MNNHQRHLEDLVLYDGASGAERTIWMLKDMIDMPSSPITIKVDGSPSIFFGRDGRGRFFVSTKSIFNKTPIVYSTEAEIENSTMDESLKDKLIAALTYLPSIVTGNSGSFVVQGDYLFHDEILDGMAHPNLINYDLKPLGLKARHRFGLCIHTFYPSGLADMSDSIALYRSEPVINSSRYVFQYPIVPQLPSYCFNTENNSRKIVSIQNMYGALDPEYMDLIAESGLGEQIERYRNHRLRNSLSDVLTTNSVLDWVFYNKKKEMDSKKTEAAKDRADDKWDKIALPAFRLHFALYLDMYTMMSSLKREIINIVDNHTNGDKYVMSAGRDYWMPCNHEGYVIVDVGGEAIKLVDRETFSARNFSSDFVKGW